MSNYTDSNLITTTAPDNARAIKIGNKVFVGFTDTRGTDVSDTTATAGDVLASKYFYTSAGIKTQGTITSKAAQTYTPSTSTQTISLGQYLAGDQVISGDANLIASNIANGITIFGITGTHQGKSATVVQPAPTISVNSLTGVISARYTPVAGDVSDTSLKSSTYSLSVQAAQTITPSTSNQTIAAGRYLTGTQTISGDANLVAGNIKKDTTIFGITGSYLGGVSLSWYKCASVTQGSAGGLVVSNAGAAAVNGTYTLTNPEATGKARIWTNNNGFMLTASFAGGTRWVFVGDYVDLYYIEDESEALNPWDVPHWWCNNGPPPQPTLTYTLPSNPSWSGYLAQFNSSGELSWASSVTSDLTFGGSITPVVGGIYNQNATKKVDTVPTTTYTPTTYNQTITQNKFLTGNQTISGDANLTSANIANGITIFGVTGTHSGGLSAVAGYFTNTDGTITFTPVGGSALAVSSIYISNTGVALPLYTGINISDTTATVSDVTAGKYFYTSAGIRTVGTRLAGFVFPRGVTSQSVQVDAQYTAGWTDFSRLFDSCTALRTLPTFNTSAGTNFNSMCLYCSNLQTVPAIDFGNATSATSMFKYCSKIANFGGLLNCKVSYDLSSSSLVTHDSLMNAINGLADLTGKTGQTLTIGATNLAKLTAEEIAVATNKNWTVA